MAYQRAKTSELIDRDQCCQACCTCLTIETTLNCMGNESSIRLYRLLTVCSFHMYYSPGHSWMYVGIGVRIINNLADANAKRLCFHFLNSSGFWRSKMHKVSPTALIKSLKRHWISCSLCIRGCTDAVEPKSIEFLDSARCSFRTVLSKHTAYNDRIRRVGSISQTPNIEGLPLLEQTGHRGKCRRPQPKKRFLIFIRLSLHVMRSLSWRCRTGLYSWGLIRCPWSLKGWFKRKGPLA